MTHSRLRLFALNTARDYGERIARKLGVGLAMHEEREFEDGEHKIRALENVRDDDVFVICSLYGDTEQTVNDKLARLLFFIGALKDAAAGRVTAVVPYLCYARKDRKTKIYDPVTTRYVAALFEAIGVDAVVTMDVHNLAAYQNAFRCRNDHLEARQLFVEHFAARVGNEAVVVVSPDVGGIKRAEKFRESLSLRLGRPVSSAFMEKRRSEGVVSGEAVAGDVEARTAIIIDDMIVGGTTLARTVEACRVRGAARILAAATHGLFVGDASSKISVPALEQLVITDSVVPFRLSADVVSSKLTILDGAQLFADAIHRIHTNGSIEELMAD